MNIEKITKPEQQIISITREGLNVTDLPLLIGPSFMALGQYISEQGATILSAPFVSIKNMDEEGRADEKNMTMEVGFPIDKLIPNSDPMISYILPSYKAVSTLYIGKYENMIPVYRKLMEEIEKVNGTFMNCCYEYYLSDEEIPEAEQETILEVPYH